MAIKALKNQAGIGLRQPHYEQVLQEKPDIAWLEVHSENFFYLDSVPAQQLLKIRQDYPISMHGIGLSLGSSSCDGTTNCTFLKHLEQLKNATDCYEPVLISEHLSWNAIGGQYVNDLLPLPYTQESLLNFCENVKKTQDFLGRQILIENPSTYLSFAQADMPEWVFYAQLPSLTGCGLLFDVNNVVVNAHNHQFVPDEYLAAVSTKDVLEIHLAGATINQYEGRQIMIDDHGSAVSSQVWDFFAKVLKTFGNKPSLIERDNHIPPLSELVAEAQKAQFYLDQNS